MLGFGFRVRFAPTTRRRKKANIDNQLDWNDEKPGAARQDRVVSQIMHSFF